MEDQLVGLVIGTLTIIAGYRDRDTGWDQATFQRFDPGQNALADVDRIGPVALGNGDGDGRRHVPALRILRPAPATRLILRCALLHARYIAEQHRRANRRSHGQPAHFLRASQGLPGSDRQRLPAFANRTCGEGPTALPDGLQHRGQWHPCRRQLCRIGDHSDGLALAARDECDADVIDLGHFGPQFRGQIIERLVVPQPRRARFGRQRQHHDGHIGNAARGDLRRGDTGRDPVDIGLDLFIDTGRCGLRVRPHQEAGRHHHAVIVGLRINVLDAVNRLDDALKRLGHQLHIVRRRKPRSCDTNVDHRHADLRLFLTRDDDRSHQPHQHRGQQEQRRQRRGDGGAGDAARDAQFHEGFHYAPPASVSPAATPERISTLPSPAGAVCTGTCTATPFLATTVT